MILMMNEPFAMSAHIFRMNLLFPDQFDHCIDDFFVQLNSGNTVKFICYILNGKLFPVRSCGVHGIKGISDSRITSYNVCYTKLLRLM